MKRILTALLVFTALGSVGITVLAADRLEGVLKKQRIKILVTDSGLGGLSVCGDLEQRALTTKRYESVEIVFCNALPEADCGYNQLKTDRRRAEVFSAALQGMVDYWRPDVILIACNTLSVVYPETAVSKTLKPPVVGIIELGVGQLRERLAADSNTSAVIFGTETTIAAGAHKAGLVAGGLAASRIVAQPCSELAGEIQAAPRGEAAKNLIDLYVGEAVEQLQERRGRIVAALCCTHYGYCADVFAQAFADAGRKEVEIVNPNERMAGLLFPAGPPGRAANPQVTVRVVSRALLSPEEIGAISALLERASPRTAAALRVHERKPDLFPFAPE